MSYLATKIIISLFDYTVMFNVHYICSISQ